MSLAIEVPGEELFDEVNSCFIERPPCTLTLEHSLISLTKWEARWKEPFLAEKEKTPEQALDYVRCMTLTQNVPPDVYGRLTAAQMEAIRSYIDDPMTATTFSSRGRAGSRREKITSELIYYWMVSLGIPFECQKWHLNRLLTLIRVCSLKNQPSKKMSANQILRNNSALNAARRSQYHTKG